MGNGASRPTAEARTGRGRSLPREVPVPTVCVHSKWSPSMGWVRERYEEFACRTGKDANQKHHFLTTPASGSEVGKGSPYNGHSTAIGMAPSALDPCPIYASTTTYEVTSIAINNGAATQGRTSPWRFRCAVGGTLPELAPGFGLIDELALDTAASGAELRRRSAVMSAPRSGLSGPLCAMRLLSLIAFEV